MDKIQLSGLWFIVCLIVAYITFNITHYMVNQKWEKSAIVVGAGEYVKEDKVIMFKWKQYNEQVEKWR